MTSLPPIDKAKVETLTDRIAAAGRESCRMDLEFWRPQLDAFERCQVEDWLIALAKANIARCEAHLAAHADGDVGFTADMPMIARDDI